VSNNQEAEFGMAPATEGDEGKMQHGCFSLSCLHSEREQVSLVTVSHPLPENCSSTSLFTTVYKRLTEEGGGGGNG
jgi:hypothetical protein